MYLVKQQEDQSNKVIWQGDPEGFIRSVSINQSIDYPLLSGVALYEDTYFNSLQIKDLVLELEVLKKNFTGVKDIEEFNSLINFVEEVKMQELLVFVGD